MLAFKKNLKSPSHSIKKGFSSLTAAVLCGLTGRPPGALQIAQIPSAKLTSITQQDIELAENAVTLTSYFHQLQSQWQVAKLQNTPENPVEAKQVVKAFFISRGTRGNKWRLLLASIPNSPLLSCWNGPGKKNVCISHIYSWQLWIFLLLAENFLSFPLFLYFLFFTRTQIFSPQSH